MGMGVVLPYIGWLAVRVVGVEVEQVAPIERVIEDGVAHVLEVKANLMSSPRHRKTYREREGPRRQQRGRTEGEEKGVGGCKEVGWCTERGLWK